MLIAPGLEDSDKIREHYFDIMLKRLENTRVNLYVNTLNTKAIVLTILKRYNAYKGNAYGLANTLAQTANFKPKIINKKINNLFYTGH